MYSVKILLGGDGRRAAAAAAGVLALAICGTAYAATDTDNLSVTATVTANCTISTSPVAFGSYDPISSHAATPLDASGSLSVTCTSGSSAEVTLGQGANADAGSSDDAPLRRMSDDGTNFLSYALYSDAGLTTVWGNTASSDVELTGTGSAQALTVYGQVASGQSVPAASYSDTIVATVTF